MPEADGVRLERLRMLLAILLRHPDLLHDVEQAFCHLELPDELGAGAGRVAGLGRHALRHARCAGPHVRRCTAGITST